MVKGDEGQKTEGTIDDRCQQFGIFQHLNLWSSSFQAGSPPPVYSRCSHVDIMKPANFFSVRSQSSEPTGVSHGVFIPHALKKRKSVQFTRVSDSKISNTSMTLAALVWTPCGDRWGWCLQGPKRWALRKFPSRSSPLAKEWRCCPWRTPQKSSYQDLPMSPPSQRRMPRRHPDF